MLTTILSGAALAVACTSDPTCSTDWPSASGAVLHVSAQCGSASGDGSADKPYATIGTALSKAKSGTTVVVGSGSYAESLTVPAGVSILGAGHSKVTIAPKAGVGVRVESAGSNTLGGFSISGAQSIGLLVKGATVKATDLAISGTLQTKADDGTLQPGGHGIQITETGNFTAESCQVTGNMGTGVLAQHVGVVAIIDPVFKVGARGAGVAIIDPVFAPSSTVANNAGGGIAIIDPVFAPAGLTDDPKGGGPSLVLKASNIAGNSGFGIALYGGGASIERSAIQDTKAVAGQDFADGVVMAPAVVANATTPADPKLTVDEGSVVAANGRAGLLIAARADVQISSAIASNGLGGLWAQSAGSSVRLLAKARFSGNALLGAAATAGASLDVSGATIQDTKAKLYAPPAGGMPAQVGDGLAIFNGARARIIGATLSGNARAGVLVDGAATEAGSVAGQKVLSVEIAGTTFSGGEVGIAVNKSTQGVPSAAGLAALNKFSTVKANVDTATQLGAQTALCALDASHSACDDRNACTVDTCDAAKGCQYAPVADGTACQDGSSCTFEMACTAGACVGKVKTCDDGNPCTKDGCDKTGACVHTNTTDKCNDGNLCTSFDACVGGACQGSARACDDGDAATADACSAATGECEHKK